MVQNSIIFVHTHWVLLTCEDKIKSIYIESTSSLSDYFRLFYFVNDHFLFHLKK